MDTSYTIVGDDGAVHIGDAEYVSGAVGGDVFLVHLKAEALRDVDTTHATFMRNLTGNASIEERDTWQAKELAAHALTSGDATPAQTEMLVIEAGYLGIEPAILAATITTKADQFKKLTGLAAGVRGKARAAIAAAKTTKALQNAVDTAKADIEGALALLQGG